MRLKITGVAEKDVENIYRYSIESFGQAKAETYANGLFDLFELTLHNPFIARERLEHDLPVRVHTYKAHKVIFRVEADALIIVRILSNRQNWPDYL